MKSCQTGASGMEQIVNFHFPGEVPGIDALGSGVHSCSAMALERSTICYLPIGNPAELLRHTPEGLSWYMKLASQELVRIHQASWMLNRMKAKVRMARFLIDLSRRFGERGYSTRVFNLSMSRHDIGNYLGLTVETVSRLLSGFQLDGLLEVHRRQITLLAIAALEAAAGLPADPAPIPQGSPKPELDTYPEPGQKYMYKLHSRTGQYAQLCRSPRACRHQA
jgi:CRP/FNR family transcriptional regulator